MTPIVNGLTEAYTGRLEVMKLNAIGDGKEAFAYYRLTGHPSYILFSKDGAKVWTHMGLRTREEIVQQIESVLLK